MSFSTARVSVIIPCLNAERTLGDALDSVFAQTVRPMEVLVIDDHSTDRSAVVARKHHPSVRVLTNPSRGSGAARRLGVEQARGDFIAFVDADDMIHPLKHEKQLVVLENSDPHTLVHTGAWLQWADGRQATRQRRSAQSATGRCMWTIFESNPVCGASTMLRRSVILEVGNYDAALFNCADFGMSLVASTCCDFVYLPEPLYVITRHANNVSSRKADMAYHHWLAQEKFRRRFPAAFATLPPDSIRRYMVEPVLRAVREAYWRRESVGYRRLVELAMRLAPDDPVMQRFYRRRYWPMRVLRWLDRFRGPQAAAQPEAS